MLRSYAPYERGLPSEFKRSFRFTVSWPLAFVYEWRRGALDWGAA